MNRFPIVCVPGSFLPAAATAALPNATGFPVSSYRQPIIEPAGQTGIAVNDRLSFSAR
jgi:hypothetical protein